MWSTAINNNSAQITILTFFPYFAAEVSVGSAMMGFLTSIQNLITALFQGPIGRLSDKKGRKNLLLLGFFLSFSITVTLIFTHNQTMLIIISVLQALAFSIIIPVFNATLGDVTEIRGRSTFIGKLTSAGQALGVVLMLTFSGLFFFFDKFKGWVILGRTIPMLSWKTQYGIVFGMCAVNFLICVIGMFFLRETKPETVNEPPKMFLALKNKDFRFFLIVNTIFGITMSAFWPIYPIIQIQIFQMNFYQIAITTAFYTIIFSFAGFLGGKIGDQIGRKPLMIFSRVIMFTVTPLYIPGILMDSWYWVFLTNFVSAIGNGIFMVIMNAYALDLSSEETKGAFSGLTQTFWGTATFLGALVAGFISQALERKYDFVTVATALIIAIAILRLLAVTGYFFVKESLTEDNRLPRPNKKQRKR